MNLSKPFAGAISTVMNLAIEECDTEIVIEAVNDAFSNYEPDTDYLKGKLLNLVETGDVSEDTIIEIWNESAPHGMELEYSSMALNDLLKRLNDI